MVSDNRPFYGTYVTPTPIIPLKDEPYAQVKKRAHYMVGLLWEDGFKSGHNLVETILDKLIETAPQQTLSALCEVLDPDATRET
jgi:hypothetical protein